MPDTKYKLADLLGRYEVTIPENGLDQVGIDKVQGYLRCSCLLPQIPDIITLPGGKVVRWRWDWKVGGRGEYVGTLPKRIGKYLWQVHKKKLTLSQLEAIGNIGSAHAYQGDKRGITYWFDIVDHMDWERTDFGQPDSCCYWSCHSGAKDMILSADGGAIRFFTTDTYNINRGYARAWIIPWKKCLILFNGYGMTTLAVARILAFGLKHLYYREVDLSNNSGSTELLWINGGVGYVVGSQKDVLLHNDINLRIKEINNLLCSSCEGPISESAHFHAPNDSDYCEDCWNDQCFICTNCERTTWSAQGSADPDGSVICESCWDRNCFECSACLDPKWKISEPKWNLSYCKTGRLLCAECRKEEEEKSKEKRRENEEEEEELEVKRSTSLYSDPGWSILNGGIPIVRDQREAT